MIRHPSAEKRAREAVKRRARARVHKGDMRAEIKKVMDLIEEGKIDEARAESKRAESAIARAVSKGVVKRQKGARLTSRLVARVNRAAAALPKAPAAPRPKPQPEKQP
jgi:small subunit ribosomal protein S20